MGFLKEGNIQSVIGKDNTLLWSGSIDKINCNRKTQERDFLVTKESIYNLGKPGWWILSIFTKRVKRIIRIDDIKALTLSTVSNGMILHVPSQYDYYLYPADRSSFLLSIFQAFCLREISDVVCYLVDESNLFKYTQLESEKIRKHPKVEPEPFTSSLIENMLESKPRSQEEMITGHGNATKAEKVKIDEKDFEFLKILGKGHFAKVFLAEKTDTKKLYAVKVINKMDIIKRNFFENLKSEKSIMQTIRSPFLVNLEYCFSSPSRVYFAMDFKQGGELYHHLRKQTRFSEEIVKFYACQILTGLVHLHSMNMIYRDMKPENILLDEKGNACISDFGISKIIDPRETTKSFVGTPEYLAPELILQKGYNKAVDIWGFGILLYEMLYGLPPFYNKNQNVMLNWVVKVDPSFPKEIKTSPEIKQLISKVI